MVQHGTDVDQQARLRAARSARYALRCSLWKISSRDSVRGCARNVSRNVGSWSIVMRPASGDRPAAAGYVGLQTCDSIWACPCCSARIRQARAVDVEAAGLAHLRADGGLEFLTLTMPHDDTDALAGTLDVVLAGWRKIQQRKWFRAFRERHGLGFIRSVEITHTRREDGGSGWHPHMHVLLFTDRPLPEDARADLLGKLEAAWAAHVTSSQRPDGTYYRRPGEDGVGVNLRSCAGGYSAKGLLAYVAKVQDNYGDAWGVGAEMMRGDLKSGRRAMSRTPFELAEAAAAGDGQALLLWHEYEQATAGRRAMHWSEGLRARYLAGPEPEDGDVPEVEQAEEDLVLTVAGGTHDEWRLICRSGAKVLLPRLLALAEDGRYEDLDALLANVLDRDTGPPPAAADPCAAGVPVEVSLPARALAAYAGRLL
jgi:hypothetical protein